MTSMEKDYMDRYIYQVIRRLPRAQKSEVRMELEELIDDLYADKGSMEEALTELGDPAEFAKQYRKDQSYLIGPEYFDTWLWFVKVVLICSAVPIVAVSLINALTEIPDLPRAVAGGLIRGITNALAACVSAFGIVTLIFTVMEHKKIQFEMKKAGKWSVEALEPVPDRKTVISRGDSVVGIIFIILLCVLLIFAPRLFSVFLKDGGSFVTVPFFNLDRWGTILPVLILSLLAGLSDEILRLVAGVYCRLVLISNIVSGAVQIVLSVVVLKLLPFWNPDFLTELQAAPGSTGKTWLLAHWDPDLVSGVLLALIIVLTLAETGVTFYKTLRSKAS